MSMAGFGQGLGHRCGSPTGIGRCGSPTGIRPAFALAFPSEQPCL
jgi:hypothetical protein